MRDIKFRAWVVKKQKMHILNESWLDYCNEGGQALKLGFGHGFLDDYTDGSYRIGEDVVLMQYTGLKDKDGKEIYEGDIVEGEYRFGEKIIGVVKYGAMAFGYVGKKLDGSRWFDTITTPGYTQDRHIEVIGNVYENPELLEKNEKNEKSAGSKKGSE